ncbi:unnamed protein product [Closterium sp. Naga37s-1]|nr:unnamed protein product [Closterium sp. Naga37s-1]
MRRGAAPWNLTLPPPFLPPDPCPPTVVLAQSLTRRPAPQLPHPTTSPPQQQPSEGRGRVEGGAGVAHGGHPFHTSSPPTAKVVEGKATGKHREAAPGGTTVAVAECAAAAAA